MSTFEAGTTVFCELAFTDRLGAAATPTAVTIQVLDSTNGQVLLVETPVTPPVSPASTLEIPIAAITNAMTRSCTSQLMTVVIRATYADGSRVVSKSGYTLDNPTYLVTQSAL